MKDNARPISPAIGPFTWIVLVAVAIAAAVLSFASLRDLAVVCGTPGQLAFLLPVAIDAAAVVATRVWLSPSAATQRGEARKIALGTLALSVAGNAMDHFLGAYHMVPPWWAVVAVAAVPPIVLATVAHLVAGLVAGVANAHHAPVVPVQTERTDEPTGSTERTDEELLVQLRAMAVATGQAPSLTATRTGLRVGTGRARRLLDQYAAEHTPALHAVGGERR